MSKQRSKGQPDQFSVEVCHFLFLLFSALFFFLSWPVHITHFAVTYMRQNVLLHTSDKLPLSVISRKLQYVRRYSGRTGVSVKPVKERVINGLCSKLVG